MSVNKLNGPTQQPGEVEPEVAKKPSKIGAVFSTIGKVAGVAAGFAFPGVGPVVGGILGGASGMNGFNLKGTMLGPDASQFLQYQQQMTMESRAFELASTILKNRHDASMSAIRNMKS